METLKSSPNRRVLLLMIIFDYFFLQSWPFLIYVSIHMLWLGHSQLATIGWCTYYYWNCLKGSNNMNNILSFYSSKYQQCCQCKQPTKLLIPLVMENSHLFYSMLHYHNGYYYDSSSFFFLPLSHTDSFNMMRLIISLHFYHLICQ